MVDTDPNNPTPYGSGCEGGSDPGPKRTGSWKIAAGRITSYFFKQFSISSVFADDRESNGQYYPTTEGDRMEKTIEARLLKRQAS